MTVEEAKKIIREQPKGNIAERLEAIRTAVAILGDDADEGCREDGDDDFHPHEEGVTLYIAEEAALLFVGLLEGPEAIPEGEDYGQDGAQLDDDQEDLPVGVGDVEIEDLLGEHHVAGGADREPFGDAFDDADDDDFQIFEHIITPCAIRVPRSALFFFCCLQNKPVYDVHRLMQEKGLEPSL